MTLTARRPSEVPGGKHTAQAPHHHHHGWHAHSRKVAPLPVGGDLPAAQVPHNKGGQKGHPPQGAAPVKKGPAKGGRDPVLSPSAFKTIVVEELPPAEDSHWEFASTTTTESTSTLNASVKGGDLLSAGGIPMGIPVPMSPASSITTTTSTFSSSTTSSSSLRPGAHPFRSFSVSRPKVVYPSDADQIQAGQPRQRSLPRDPPGPQHLSQAQPQPQRQLAPRLQAMAQAHAVAQSQVVPRSQAMIQSQVMGPPQGITSHQAPPPQSVPPQQALPQQGKAQQQQAALSHHNSFSHSSFSRQPSLSQQGSFSQQPPLSQQGSFSSQSFSSKHGSLSHQGSFSQQFPTPQQPPLPQQHHHQQQQHAPLFSSMPRQLSYGRSGFLGMRSLSVRHASGPQPAPEGLPSSGGAPSQLPSRPSTGLVSSASISHGTRRRAEVAAAEAAHAAAQRQAAAAHAQAHAQGHAQAPRLQHLTSAQLHVSRKGQYDVVAVAFWIVVLEGGCELQVMRGRTRRNIQETGAPGASAPSAGHGPSGAPSSAAAAARPSTAGGARPRAGAGLAASGRQQWDAPLGGLAVSQDLEGVGGLLKGGAGGPSSFWEKVTGVGKGAPAAQFTLHLDHSPYPLLSWTHSGLFGASNKLVRVYTAHRVDAGEWEFVLETSKGPLFLKAPSRDWYLVWTEGVRAILRYAQEISARRQGSP